MKRVLAIGNSLVDFIIKLPNFEYLEKIGLPKGSMNLVNIETIEKILQDTKEYQIQQSAGGSAANTINGLAKLNVPTAFIGKIGADMTGKFFNQDLQHNSVGALLKTSDSPTGRVAALITPDSERTFATYLGASIELSADDLNPAVFKEYNICYIEGYLVQNYKLVETACEYAYSAGCDICIDLASYNVVNENKDFIRKIIKNYINIIFANEEEAKAFTGAAPEDAVNILGDMVDLAIVKVGKDGSLVKKGEELFKVGAIKANAIDTTGAGDLYAAGFLYGYLTDQSLDVCATYGAITAGNVVEIFGAKLPDDRWRKIKQQLKINK